MLLAEIAARALAAREFVHTSGERNFTLRLPTRHDASIALAEAGGIGALSAAAEIATMRALVARAVVAWSGVTVADFLGADAVPDPVECTPAAVTLLLDERADLEAELRAAFTARWEARGSELGVAKKN